MEADGVDPRVAAKELLASARKIARVADGLVAAAAAARAAMIAAGAQIDPAGRAAIKVLETFLEAATEAGGEGE